MNPISGFSSPALSAATMLPPVATAALGKGAKAAREFEAQLVRMVLEKMEKTFAALPGQDAIAGEDNYNYLGTQALASTIAAGGGFGIARLIAQSFTHTKVAPEGLARPAPEAGASR
jgi:Rod binding domain-containing protein